MATVYASWKYGARTGTCAAGGWINNKIYNGLTSIQQLSYNHLPWIVSTPISKSIYFAQWTGSCFTAATGSSVCHTWNVFADKFDAAKDAAAALTTALLPNPSI